jgi:hypothetical protein
MQIPVHKIDRRIKTIDEAIADFEQKKQNKKGRWVYSNCIHQLKVRREEAEQIKLLAEKDDQYLVDMEKLILDLSRIPIPLIHEARIEHFIKRAQIIMDETLCRKPKLTTISNQNGNTSNT